MIRSSALVLLIALASTPALGDDAAFLGEHHDPRLTPGEVVSFDPDVACVHRVRLYDTDRAAYEAQARRVFAAYGVPYEMHEGYELDHFIPRCMGGADTDGNLWPQRCDMWSHSRPRHCLLGPAETKDRSEWRICHEVCAWREMTVEQGVGFFKKNPTW